MLGPGSVLARGLWSEPSPPGAPPSSGASTWASGVGEGGLACAGSAAAAPTAASEEAAAPSGSAFGGGGGGMFSSISTSAPVSMLLPAVPAAVISGCSNGATGRGGDDDFSIASPSGRLSSRGGVAVASARGVISRGLTRCRLLGVVHHRLGSLVSWGHHRPPISCRGGTSHVRSLAEPAALRRHQVSANQENKKMRPSKRKARVSRD